MQDSELVEFSTLLAGLGELYERKLSKTLIEIYWTALKEYSLDDVKKAVNNIVATHKYATFPKPAEFIEYINPSQAAEDQAELMMKEFWQRFDDSGYHNFTWDNPVLAMAVELYGGWRMILDAYPRTDEKDAKFWQKDFKNIIRMFIINPRKIVNLKFVGSFEEDNRTKGYLTDKTGEPIALPNGEGYIMLNSPEAKKYLEDYSAEQKQITHNQGLDKNG